MGQVQRGLASMADRDLAKAQELLTKLKVRGMCFDLMVDFCDRASREGRLDQARAAWLAMDMIHRGDARS